MADLIQRVTATLATDEISHTVTGYTATSTNAFARIVSINYSGRGNAGTTNWEQTVCLTTNTPDTSIVIERPITGIGETCSVDLEIWDCDEFPAGWEAEVRHTQRIDFANASGTQDSTTTDAVTDDDDVVVFLTGSQARTSSAYNWQAGLATAEWNGPTTDTVTMTRDDTTNPSRSSIAVVEFTGTNWSVQRITHSFTAEDTDEDETLTTTHGATGQAFIHTQLRVNNNSAYSSGCGFETWLTSTTNLRHRMEELVTGGANTVTWIVEDTSGDLVVSAIDDVVAAASATDTATISISDTTQACIMGECGMTATEVTNSAAENMVGMAITSTTVLTATRVDTTLAVPYRAQIVDFSGLGATPSGGDAAPVISHLFKLMNQ